MILLPRLLNSLARYWGMPSAAAVELWGALEEAESPKACAWRTQLLTNGLTDPAVADAFIRSAMAPRQVIEAVESLVEEARLTRVQANALEHHILSRVQADGAWCP